MTAKVESVEEIKRGLVKELKKKVWLCLERIEDFISEDEWERALAAVDTIQYIIRMAREWNRAA